MRAWISNYTSYKSMDVNTYPCPNISQSMWLKGARCFPTLLRNNVSEQYVDKPIAKPGTVKVPDSTQMDNVLKYWGQAKLSGILQMMFSKWFFFYKNLRVLTIGHRSHNGLAPNKWHAIIWTTDNLPHWRVSTCMYQHKFNTRSTCGRSVCFLVSPYSFNCEKLPSAFESSHWSNAIVEWRSDPAFV